nr:unnamed protein product [Callosobruchus chinensis]
MRRSTGGGGGAGGGVGPGGDPAATPSAGILSPRGSDNGGGLGVKMVEYVLGTSPTGKEGSAAAAAAAAAGLEPRMRGLHLGGGGGAPGGNVPGSQGGDQMKKTARTANRVRKKNATASNRNNNKWFRMADRS